MTARSKGADFERKAIKFLQPISDGLGREVKLYRNLTQTVDGGADIIDFPPFAIEVKAQKTLAVAKWWRQTCRQTTEDNPLPLLMYRHKGKWLFMANLLEYTVTLDEHNATTLIINQYEEYYDANTINGQCQRSQE